MGDYLQCLQVLIKIMKHCRDYFPTPVNGLLLGLDQPESLEVTDCFGLQNKQDLWNQLSREKIDIKEVDVRERDYTCSVLQPQFFPRHRDKRCVI